MKKTIKSEKKNKKIWNILKKIMKSENFEKKNLK